MTSGNLHQKRRSLLSRERLLLFSSEGSKKEVTPGGDGDTAEEHVGSLRRATVQASGTFAGMYTEAAVQRPPVQSRGNPANAEANKAIRAGRVVAETIRNGAVVGIAATATAAPHTEGTRWRVAIPTPFPKVSAHVVGPKFVGGKLAHGMG